MMAAALVGWRASVGYRAHVSVESLLVLVLGPLAIFGVLAVWTLRPKFTRTPRYRPGQEWTYPPVWWMANPEEVPGAHSGSGNAQQAADSKRGGARGSW